jgi:hypothetical protein
MASRRTWEPRSYPIRDPRTTAQQQGRIVNPVRALKFAGRGESTLLNPNKFQPGTNGPNAAGPVADRGRGSK